jgi:transposase-like protein
MERMYYSPELKAKALDCYETMHENCGWTATRVARKFDINANTLRAWIAEESQMLSLPKQRLTQAEVEKEVARLVRVLESGSESLSGTQEMNQDNINIDFDLKSIATYVELIIDQLQTMQEMVERMRKETHGKTT